MYCVTVMYGSVGAPSGSVSFLDFISKLRCWVTYISPHSSSCVSLVMSIMFLAT